MTNEEGESWKKHIMPEEEKPETGDDKPATDENKPESGTGTEENKPEEEESKKMPEGFEFCNAKNDFDQFEGEKPEAQEFCHKCFPGCITCNGPKMSDCICDPTDPTNPCTVCATGFKLFGTSTCDCDKAAGKYMVLATGKCEDEKEENKGKYMDFQGNY